MQSHSLLVCILIELHFEPLQWNINMKRSVPERAVSVLYFSISQQEGRNTREDPRLEKYIISISLSCTPETNNIQPVARYEKIKLRQRLLKNLLPRAKNMPSLPL
jgi:hypothetical protein